MGKLTLHSLLELYGLDPKTVKLVRHTDKEIKNVMDVFKNNRGKLEAYQSFQGKPVFKGATHIAVFASSTSTSAVFIGIWDIVDFVPQPKLTLELHAIIDNYGFNKENGYKDNWHETVSWYDMKFNSTMNELSARLVIEWGKSAISWVQSVDKEILEIKPVNYIGDFISYDKVQLNYEELKQIVEKPNSNFTWVSALKSVKGVYLIRDTVGKGLYVGSASGKDGFMQRWSSYARNGNGGNIGLMGLDCNNFVFSILEIVSATFSEADILYREDCWKVKLGAREDHNMCHN